MCITDPHNNSLPIDCNLIANDDLEDVAGGDVIAYWLDLDDPSIILSLISVNLQIGDLDLSRKMLLVETCECG